MRQTFDETTDPSFGARHLPRVRARMAEQGLDGLLVPHEDEHQNEYLPAANDRLAWLSGFTGSAGAGVRGGVRGSTTRSANARRTCRTAAEWSTLPAIDTTIDGAPART